MGTSYHSPELTLIQLDQKSERQRSAKVNFEHVFGAEKDIGCEPPSPGGAAVPGYTRIFNVTGQSASLPPFFRS